MPKLDPAEPVHAYVRHLYADRDDPTCRSRYIRLGIYPTAEALRDAGNRYRGNDDLTDAEGLFQPTPFRSRYDRKKRRWVDTTPAFAGVMRLHRGRLEPMVVAHEATHAALHITRLHDWAQPEGHGHADFDGNCDDQEEAFAHLLGDLTGVLTTMVNRYKRKTRTHPLPTLPAARLTAQETP